MLSKNRQAVDDDLKIRLQARNICLAAIISVILIFLWPCKIYYFPHPQLSDDFLLYFEIKLYNITEMIHHNY